MIKQFRYHRGSFIDSIKTSIEVNGIDDIREQFNKSVLKNIKIKNDPIEDNRLPENWGNIEYIVVADFDDYEEQCIGFCNFYDK